VPPPVEKIRLDPEHPYPGPSSFDEEHAAFFHGRGPEAGELFALVELRPLTVLHGKSGLGKTSLLQAGLFPRLRQSGLVPIRLRLGFGVDEDGQRHPALADQVRRRLREVIERGELDGAPPREGESLWEYFHWTGFWDAGGRPVMPVLVLDQFEEVFTLGRDRGDELRALIRELADLVENRIPASVRDAAQAGRARLPPSFDAPGAKVLLALREEFLAQLDDHRPQMPSLSVSRYRLRPLGGLAARDAVLEPGRAVVTEDVAAALVRKLGSAADDAPLETVEEIEPALLALYCHELNAIRERNKQPRIDAAMLAGSEEEILDQFYERCLRGLPEAVRLLVEEKLLTPDNRRDTLALGRASGEGVAEADVQKLVDRRLLRKEPRLGHAYVEIVHDKLVRTIAGKRDERRRREREAERAEEQVRREAELREQAEEGRQRAEAERLRADAEGLRADAERLRAEEGERQRGLLEKLAATRKRSNLILWALVAVLTAAAVFVPAYGVWTARQTDEQKKIAADDARIEDATKRAADLAALGFRAAADQRWDDVARTLAPAYRAIDEARRAQTDRAGFASARGAPGRPDPSPLLSLLAARFEASAGRIAAGLDEPARSDAFVLTPDGRVAAVLDSDGRRVRLLDLSGQRAPTEAEPPGAPGPASDKEVGPSGVELSDVFAGALRALVPSGDGGLLFGQGDKGQVVVWRVEDGRRRLGFRTRLPHAELAVDRAGRHAVLWDRHLDQALVVTLDAEGGRVDRAAELRLDRQVEARPGRARGRLRGPHGAASLGEWASLTPTPDGARVLGVWTRPPEGGGRDLRGRSDLTLWDAATGAAVARFPAPGAAVRAAAFRVTATALADDGGLLAALSDDGEVHLLRVGAASLEPAAVLPGRVPPSGSIAFQEGKRALLVCTDGAVALWDVTQPEAPRPAFELGTGGFPRRAALPADGQSALVWLDDEVRLYDVGLGQPRAAVALPDADRGGPSSAATSAEARFAQGGERPLTARDALRVRSLGADPLPLDRYRWGEAVGAKATFSALIPRAGLVQDVAADGERLAVLADGAVSIVTPLGPDKLEVTAWSPRDPTLLRAVRLAQGRVAALDDDGSVRFGEARVATLRRATDEVGWGGLLALSADRAWAVTAGRGTRVYLWDADSAQRAWTADVRQESSAAPFSGEVVTVTAVATGDDDPEKPFAIVADARGGVRAMRTGGPARNVSWSSAPFTPSPHHDAVRAVEIGPGGRVATGAEDGTVALWDRDGRIVRTLTIETPGSNAVRRLRFADEGRLLLGGSADGAVHVWRTGDGAEVCAVKHAEEIVNLAVERGAAARAASVDAGGTANLWLLATCEPIRSLRGMAYVGFLAGARDQIVTVRRTGRVELWPIGVEVSDVPRDRPRGTAAWGVFLGAETLVTGDEEGSLFSWKVAAGAAPARLAGEIGGAPSVASAAGREVTGARAVVVTPEGLVRSWSVDALDAGGSGHLPAERGWAVRAVALADDGARLLTVEEGPEAALRARPFAWSDKKKWSAAGAARELRPGPRCNGSAVPGGRTFVAAATEAGLRALVVDGAGCVRIWDDGGKLLVEGLGSPGGAADAAGRVAAAALGRGADRIVLAAADGAVSTWAVEADGIRRVTLPQRRHTARVRTVAFHPEGRFVVTAGDDQQVWLWDSVDGRPLTRLGAHPAPIHWAAFRPGVGAEPGGAELVTGGADGWMRVWSTTTHSADVGHVLEVVKRWLPEAVEGP
jgi:WD40 repeat protein